MKKKICKYCNRPISYEPDDTVWLHDKVNGKYTDGANGYWCKKYMGKSATPKV